MNKVLITLLVLCSFSSLFSQKKNSKKDIKVGLVLSGGGAKGFAHIGALKVIEEAGVQIDYIGGTSMGAIVGALYASGYSAAELDSIFRKTDFSKLIQGDIPRNAKTFYEKEDSERYALSLPFEKFKVSFPAAISSGQSIYNVLVRYLYHVRDVDDFNDLPIPFFCIATDVETGEEIVLNKGYLPEAIMASGTFPSLFEPSDIGDNLLIDGGVVNNYPVEKVKKMGADVIIGVDVQHGLSDRETLSSATEVLLQINNYRTVKDMVEKSKNTDIYIKPDIEKYSVIDFGLLNEIIDKGEVAARENFIALKELANQQKRKKRPKSRIKIEDMLTIKNLSILGSDHYSRGYVKGKLRLPTDNSLSFERLQQGVSNLAATGNFKTIRYQLHSNDDKADLLIKLNENPVNTYIKMGMHYDDLLNTAALVNITKKKIFFGDDVGSLDFIIGDNVRYNLEYYVDKGTYWSFGFNSRYFGFSQQIDYDLFESNFDVPNGQNINTVSLDISDFTNQFYVQTQVKEEFAFTLGIEHKFLKFGTKTLGEESSSTSERFDLEKSNFYSVYGKLILDTYDDKFFPTKGVYFNGDFHYYVASSDFNNNFKDFSVTQARMGAAFPLINKLSLNIEAEGGFKLGISPVSSFDFVLGGFGAAKFNNFVPFMGYDFLGLPGNSFVKSSARLDYEFVAKNHVTFMANYANVDDDLFRTGEWFKVPKFSGYGVGYGWESFIGPVQVVYSWSPEGKENKLFFSIGYWF
ncbi:patatin-like phospholipase family protein [Cellulophaga sp. HaHaR_3_176]|uniref:patatin-like phospholipase family protein n=1 Tax=Cellulophaga sp. HaHaR_3_176 TaxID=1942464 RepID=UPI001C1F5658|nr:patatin-like phospholipase family protein [Cellulophaga sp. HaHaR_3_176]QWX83388.1 patatin-like phospholipase family protein [Cellulophaga sp. HaHaR_3_176]